MYIYIYIHYIINGMTVNSMYHTSRDFVGLYSQSTSLYLKLCMVAPYLSLGHFLVFISLVNFGFSAVDEG